MMKAAIIGSGLMGTAMAWPLVDNGNEVYLIGTYKDDEIIDRCKLDSYHIGLKRKLPEGVTPFHYDEIKKIIKDADIILNGTSSEGIEWFSELLPEIYNEKQKIISITKGLRVTEEGQVNLFPEIIKKNLGDKIRENTASVAVGGPCIAGELAARRHTCVYFGSNRKKDAEYFTDLFSTEYYHPIPTDDLMGLEICVALKNAYTVAVGLAYGMLEAQGGVDLAGADIHNTAAALFAESCVEMKKVLEVLGCESKFASSLPGPGDLYVTSAGGRTITLGKLLGKGVPYSEAKVLLKNVTLESVQIIQQMGKAVPVWEKNGKIMKKDLPLLRSLIMVIMEDRLPELPFKDFFR